MPPCRKVDHSWLDWASTLPLATATPRSSFDASYSAANLLKAKDGGGSNGGGGGGGGAGPQNPWLTDSAFKACKGDWVVLDLGRVVEVSALRLSTPPKGWAGAEPQAMRLERLAATPGAAARRLGGGGRVAGEEWVEVAKFTAVKTRDVQEFKGFQVAAAQVWRLCIDSNFGSDHCALQARTPKFLAFLPPSLFFFSYDFLVSTYPLACVFF